ncbi:MAG TPA: alanine--tRNA ligase-related protein, partial [bacterium]
KVTALFAGNERVERAGEGTEVEVILDRTPFYPAGGGQVGDTGAISTRGFVVEVRDTRRAAGGIILHIGVVRQGAVAIGDSVRAAIDAARRLDTMRNHTATHLLHRALRETLGEHARQAGSLVAPDRLRFDFVHLAPLTQEQRRHIEDRVNERILADLPVRASWLDFQEAIARGAMALFGEKYGDRVRMISIDEYSRELCGGTHLTHTGQIGVFKITQEGGVASGVRRIEAVTGRGALAQVAREEAALRAAAEQLRTTPEEVPERVRRLTEEIRELERRIRRGAAQESSRGLIDRGMAAAVTIDGTRVVLLDSQADEPEALRAQADLVRDAFDARGESAVVVLASLPSGRLVAARTRRVVPPVDAGRFLRGLAHEFGGSGGGRADLAQGGLKDPQRVAEMLARAHDQAFLETVVRRAG